MNRRDKRLFIFLVLIHGILVCLSLRGKTSIFFNDAVLRKGQAADFFAVYQAGSNVLSGQGLYLDTEGQSTPYSYPFRYLPFIGYSIGILTNIFSPFIAYYIWICFCEILLCVNIYLTWKLCRRKSSFLIAAIPWLYFSPYLLEIFMGQCSFILASLLFYSIYGVLSGSKLVFCFILAPLVKPNALILTPLFLKLRKFKLLFLTAVATLTTSASYFFFFQTDLLIFIKNFQDAWYSHGGNLGLKSLYYLIAIKYLGVPMPRVWFLGFIILLGLFTVYLTWRSKDIVLSYTLWICYYFFLYKDIWEHHYVLLMPIFAVIAAKIGITLKLLLTKKNIALLISFVLIAFPTPFILQYLFMENAPLEPDGLSPLFVLIYHSVKIAGIIILYIWSVVQLLNEKDKS